MSMPPTNRSASRLSGWQRLGTVPVVAATLVALNGLYILLVAFGNITDFGTNQAFVHHVLAMDTTNFGAPSGTELDPDVMWRAITNPTVQNIAYIGLIIWESVTAVVLIAAVVFWSREGGTGYRVARSLSTIGLLMLLLLFMGGFRCGSLPRGMVSIPPSETPCSHCWPLSSFTCHLRIGRSITHRCECRAADVAGRNARRHQVSRSTADRESPQAPGSGWLHHTALYASWCR